MLSHVGVAGPQYRVKSYCLRFLPLHRAAIETNRMFSPNINKCIAQLAGHDLYRVMALPVPQLNPVIAPGSFWNPVCAQFSQGEPRTCACGGNRSF